MSNINEMVIYELFGFSPLGAGLGVATRFAGNRALNWGVDNAAWHTAMNGDTDVANDIASFIPGLDSIVGGGLGAYQQYKINNLKDTYDRLRGIEPTSSTLGNALSIGASSLLSAIPGAGWVTSAIQGARLRDWQNKIDDLKNKIGYRNLRMGTPPLSQTGEA